ncbi:MAG: nucleotidyltransferase domain-containing protein [Clostridia bacterium]|nr:nucleotidyltransferase domain-containing protein [Clostridia bacterium]
MKDSISRLTAAIVRIMDGRVYGVWLYGSAVLNDFRPGWSDIDFIALTDGPISQRQSKALLTLRQDMLKKEPDNPYYRSFEGVIADADECRRQSFTRLVYWGTSGQRITSCYALDPFSACELARYGKPVYGGKPWILPAPGREELIRGVREHLESIRRYAVQTDERLYSCGWLLDIARCVYTLRYSEIIAKTQAGIWALDEHLFPDEEPLRKTIAIRQQPLAFRDREDVSRWLRQLGPVVQRCADVLEEELQSV